jgi:hypothetical protein
MEAVIRMARVEVTWRGYHAELPDGVAEDADDAAVRRIVTEAIRAGFAGMPADPGAELTKFVVDRYAPSETRPFPLLLIRPAVPFGGKMSYNIDNIRCIAGGDLTMPKATFDRLAKQHYHDLPSGCFLRDPLVADAAGLVCIQRLDWRGEFSGCAYPLLIEKVLPHTHGCADYVVLSLGEEVSE